MTRFAAVLAVFGLLAAAGCGGSQSGSESRDVLRVLAWGTEGSKLDDMAARFTREHPDIDLRITSVTSSAAHEKLLVGIAGGEVPDVAVVGASNMAALAHTHALEKAPAEFDQRQFLPAAIDAVQINGTAYGVPWFLDTRVLFYRTDIAAKAGVTAAPTTWAELKEAARAMQSKGGAKYGISLPTDSWHIFLPFLYQAGADITDGQRVNLNTPEVAAASAYYKSFVDEGLTPSVVREGFEIAPAFVRGTHPMFISGAWQMRRNPRSRRPEHGRPVGGGSAASWPDRSQHVRWRDLDGAERVQSPQDGLGVREVDVRARAAGGVVHRRRRASGQPRRVVAPGTGRRSARASVPHTAPHGEAPARAA